LRATILALGSRGDIVPYLALGKGLQTANFQVKFATFENFSSLITTHGLEFFPVQGDAQALLQGSNLAKSGRNPLRNLKAILQSFGSLAASYARDLAEPRLWETDLIINQLPANLFGYDAAEKLNVPYFSAAVMPLTRSSAFPNIFFPNLGRLPGYASLSHRLAEQMAWHPFRSTINRWRREVWDLPPAPFWGPFRQLEVERAPVLNGFSGQVVPRPPDWGQHIHITGYWQLPDRVWQPPADLLHFLDSGPRPIFVGFGSMPVPDAPRVTQIVLEALALSGQRGILHRGWGELGQKLLPESIYPINYAPYEWLFPHMAAVVHHGGSGSTAAGLQAGVPSIIVPFVMDQFYWGERVAALGVGPKAIPHKKLTTQRLAAAITTALFDQSMQAQAAALGEKLRAQDGVATAVQVIQEFLVGLKPRVQLR